MTVTPFSNNRSAETKNTKPTSIKKSPEGKVSLVGAGSGDAELLTLKALRIIQTADIILFDRLVSQQIRQLFPEHTTAIYVGKASGQHSLPQDELNQLLLDKAKQGLHVCRLKGGDSFIFGRGSEEMLVLKKAGIAVEVVPGITAASSCTSYAGIPLTHRGLSQGCTFVTAYSEKQKPINWISLAGLGHTLVFYMGLSQAQSISRNLIEAGLAAETPAAIIENGACPEQRVLRCELLGLAELVVQEKIQSPALIVVGKVVSLADSLAWFETTNSNNDLRSNAQEASVFASGQ